MSDEIDMSRYVTDKVFWVSYEMSDTGRMYFYAESIEHAESLLKQVQQGSLGTKDLPNVFIKSTDSEITYYGLEEVIDE